MKKHLLTLSILMASATSHAFSGQDPNINPSEPLTVTKALPCGRMVQVARDKNTLTAPLKSKNIQSGQTAI